MLNHKMYRVILWWILSLVPGAVLSADESPKSFVSIQLENDAFTLLNHRQDDYYTHGTLYSVLKIEKPPEWLSNTVEWSPFNDKSNGLD
ncbi:MAG: hypothetical protein OQK78_08845, partial [Gammaproteobacteria bacterium]|nr:hypothetical protein [Gammaproteobacteria bacterium]